MILRTNLATRPFYNSRAVQLAIGVLAAVVILFTAFNIVEIVRLTTAQQALGARASDAEAEAERLRAEAVQLRARVDPKELAVVSAAAREANTLIDQRVFSWSDLFTQFEATLPENVRITQVQPRSDNDQFIVGVLVESRSEEDLDAFIEALEATGAFHDVLPVETRKNEEGLIESVVEGVYVQPMRNGAAAAAGAAAPAADGGPRE